MTNMQTTRRTVLGAAVATGLAAVSRLLPGADRPSRARADPAVQLRLQLGSPARRDLVDLRSPCPVRWFGTTSAAYYEYLEDGKGK